MNTAQKLIRLKYIQNFSLFSLVWVLNNRIASRMRFFVMNMHVVTPNHLIAICDLTNNRLLVHGELSVDIAALAKLYL